MSELDGDSKLSSVESVFEKALGLEGEARAGFLAHVASEDAGLCARVKALLSAHEDEAGFLPGGDSVETLASEGGVSEEAGAIIGRFKLLEKLGEGGFGSVWAAEQREPVKRRVALKIIKLGMDTKQVVARFEAERQALALMDHPNIAKVLDAGTTDTGRPYFVMELVKGIPITKYFEQEGTEVAEKLRLFIRVCQAIQHAHQKGIIHRDLKPSNVMVTLHDGEPVPKVIDFGIAKATQGELTDKTIYTQYSQFIGTPAYMSPEQAEMSGLDVDTRSDIYSLGVLLYEVLTGTTPFDSTELMASGIDEMRKIIRERDPIKPSTRLSENVERSELEPQRVKPGRLSSDLDWIVLKCLEKDRARRYETANGLAKDVERHLENIPVLACPPSAVYQLQKAWRRNRLAVSSGLGMAATLIVGLTISLWQTKEATEARRSADFEAQRANQLAAKAEAESQRAKAAEALASQQADNERRLAYASDMNLAQHALELGDLGAALALLQHHVPDPGEEDLRHWEWRWLRQQCQSEGRVFGKLDLNGPGFIMSVSHDDRWLSCWTSKNTQDWKQTFFKLKTGEEARPSWLSPNLTLENFSPTSPRALVKESDHEGVRFWMLNTETGEREWELGSFEDTPELKHETVSDFSRDGSHVWILSHRAGMAAERRGGVRLQVWHVGEERSVNTFPVAVGNRRVDWGTISADGRWFAVVGRGSGLVYIYDISTGTELWSQRISPLGPSALAFSPDSRFLVCSHSNHSGEIQLRAAETGELKGRLEGHNSYITGFQFLDEGRTLVSASADQTVRLWDLESRAEIRMLRGHREEVHAIVKLHDDQTLLSGCFDGTMIRWRPGRVARQTGYERSRTLVFPRRMERPSFGKLTSSLKRSAPWEMMPSGDSLLMLDSDWNIVLRSGNGLEEREILSTVGEEDRELIFADDGRLGAVSDAEGDVFACDLSGRNADRRWLLNLPNSGFLKLHADEDLLVMIQVGPENLSLISIRYSDGRILSRHELPQSLRLLSISPDRRWLMTTNRNRRDPQLWDLGEIKPKSMSLREPMLGVWSVVFSPDSRRVVVNAEPHSTFVFGLPSGRLEKRFTAHLTGAKVASFSTDGNRLVTGALGVDAIKIWDTKTWRHLITLSVPGQVIPNPRILLDGNTLFAMDTSPVVHLWRAPSWDEIAEMDAED